MRMAQIMVMVSDREEMGDSGRLSSPLWIYVGACVYGCVLIPYTLPPSPTRTPSVAADKDSHCDEPLWTHRPDESTGRSSIQQKREGYLNRSLSILFKWFPKENSKAEHWNWAWNKDWLSHLELFLEQWYQVRLKHFS